MKVVRDGGKLNFRAQMLPSNDIFSFGDWWMLAVAKLIDPIIILSTHHRILVPIQR